MSDHKVGHIAFGPDGKSQPATQPDVVFRRATRDVRLDETYDDPACVAWAEQRIAELEAENVELEAENEQLRGLNISTVKGRQMMRDGLRVERKRAEQAEQQLAEFRDGLARFGIHVSFKGEPEGEE